MLQKRGYINEKCYIFNSIISIKYAGYSGIYPIFVRLTRFYSDFALCRPLGIGVKTPGCAFRGDAVPGAALLNGRHAWPVLHFFKGAAAAFAKRVALAGGTDSDARCVWRGVVPSQPRGHGFGWKTFAGSLVLVMIDHQSVHRCQCPQLCAQRDAIGRGAALAPVVDGGFDVSDVDGSVHVD